MLEELRDHVAKKIGPIAKPANIVFTPELPKTRSGKIMRRLLRDVAENRRSATRRRSPTRPWSRRSRPRGDGEDRGVSPSAPRRWSRSPCRSPLQRPTRPSSRRATTRRAMPRSARCARRPAVRPALAAGDRGRRALDHRPRGWRGGCDVPRFVPPATARGERARDAELAARLERDRPLVPRLGRLLGPGPEHGSLGRLECRCALSRRVDGEARRARSRARPWAGPRSPLWYDLRQLTGWSSNLAANRVTRRVGGEGAVAAALRRLARARALIQAGTAPGRPRRSYGASRGRETARSASAGAGPAAHEARDRDRARGGADVRGSLQAASHRLAGDSDVLAFESGQTIVNEGDPGETLFVVLWVRARSCAASARSDGDAGRFLRGAGRDRRRTAQRVGGGRNAHGGARLFRRR